MQFDVDSWLKIAAFLGSGLAIGSGAIGAAIGEGITAAEANKAISRNPSMAGDIFKSMLVGQAVAESSSIFALVVALILLFSNFASTSFIAVWALFSAGLCTGLGAIGSGVGAGFPAAAACKGMVRQPAMSGRLTTGMLVGAAVCQTPSVFALVVSFLLMYTDFSTKPLWPMWAAVLGAGLCAGFSAIGSGIGSGMAAQSSCEGMARQPKSTTVVTNGMLLGQAITQTPAILGLLVAFILLYKNPEATDALAPAAALLGAGLCMGIGAIGPALGEGTAAQSAVKWLARSQQHIGEITRTMLVGMAVAESTAVYAMVISLILLFVV